MWTSVGAAGGVTSVLASVVRVTALVVDVLASWSSAWTVNAYVVDGARCRRTTAVSPYQLRCWVTRTPLARTRYVTNADVSSSPRFQSSRSCYDPPTTPESVGAGGAAVSASVV